MKQLKVLVLICGLFLFGASGAHALKGQLGDAVDGDKHKHNFSANADGSGPRAANNGSNDSTKICIFCHTPHGATADTTLWNRKNPVGPAGGFKLYADPDASMGMLDGGATQDAAKYWDDGRNGIVYPNGASRLCLSCHDGVSAIGGVNNVVDSPDPSSGIEMASGEATMEAFYGAGDPAIIDLEVSHPISFVYNATVVAGINVVKGPFDDLQLPANPDWTPLDGLDRMQCTTCHDPHYDSKLVSGSEPPMWGHISADSYNEVCNNCHTGSDDGDGGIGTHSM